MIRQMSVHFLKVFLFLSLVVCATNAQAEIYKFRDPKGNVINYNQMRPIKLKEVEVLLPSGVMLLHLPNGYRLEEIEAPKVDPARPKITGTDANGNPAATAAEQAAAADETVKNLKACEIAKKNQAALSSDIDVQAKGADGKVVTLTPEQRADHLKRTEKDIAYFCEG